MRLLLTPALLVTLIILVFWLPFLLPSSPLQPARLSPGQPDAFMEKVSVLVLDQTGHPDLRIEAPRMTHYPLNDTTALLNPHVMVYRHSPVPWHIRARRGTASHGADELLFTGHVQVFHPEGDASAGTVLETDSLKILPDRRMARTADPVTIRQADAVIHAVGMTADLDSGLIHFLSQTRSEYVPS